MRTDLNLTKEEINSICKKQTIFTYIVGAVWTIVAVFVLVFAILSAVADSKNIAIGVIVAVIMAFLVLSNLKSTLEKVKIFSNISKLNNNNNGTEVKSFKSLTHKFIKFEPKGVDVDQNLYYSFIVFTILEDNKKKQYYYISKKPLKLVVNDLILNEELSVNVFKDSNVIDSIPLLEKDLSEVEEENK